MNGGFAEYVIAAAPLAAKLPAGVDSQGCAPSLCAGVTTYKGLIETEARAGQWVAISGVGGLGHVAIQYAKAMALHVAALDIAPDKLALAKQSGADLAIDASSPHAVAEIIKATGGGARGCLSPLFPASLRPGRSYGSPQRDRDSRRPACGDFPTPIFDVVLKRITVRGSVRRYAARPRRSHRGRCRGEGWRGDIHRAPLDAINTIFADLKAGRIEGRMVLDFAQLGA